MGCLSLGFEKAGGRPVVAMDANEDAASTYALNRPSTPVVLGDCRMFDPKSLHAAVGDVDAVVGGVPCEPFSAIRGVSAASRTRPGPDPKKDSRRNLINYALRLVQEFKPRWFCFENVARAVDTPTWKRARAALARAGYGVDVWKLKASDHGCPTIRRRAFLVGVRGGEAPPADAVPKAKAKTMRQALQGLPEPSDGSRDPLHKKPTPISDVIRGRLARTKKPGGLPRTDVQSMLGYYLLDGDGPAPAVLSAKYMPVHWNRKRYLSAREIARIQEIPDSYKFVTDNRNRVVCLVGDAVPVGLGHAVARTLTGAAAKADAGVDEAALRDALEGLAEAVRVCGPDGPDDLVEKAEPPSGRLPVLKVPDPAFNLARLGEGRPTGIVSRLHRRSRVGEPQFLVNERKPYGGEEAEASWVFGVVELGEAERYGSLADVPKETRAGVDEFSLAEFSAVKPVYYSPMELVAEYSPPVRLRGSPPGRRYGSEIDLDAWRAKSVGKIHSVEELEAFDLAAVPEMDDAELLRLRETLADLYQQIDRGSRAREMAVNLDIAILRELVAGRGMASGAIGEATQLDEDARLVDQETIDAVFGPITKRDFAPVNSLGAGRRGKAIRLEEFLAYVKPFQFRRSAVRVVGGIVNRGETDGDIDVLIKGPMDEATRHVIEFRLGRMFPKEIRDRLSFLGDEDLGGPFTPHVELGDLEFVTRGEFVRIEMREPTAKQDDPYMDLPPADHRKRDAVVQYHFRGKSLHLDLRMIANRHLVGWTLTSQRAGRVPDVNTVAEARRIAAGFSPKGDRYTKPFAAPSRVFAETKARQPLAWLKIEGQVFGEGEIGATAYEEGVIVAADRPKAEYGAQKPFFHEYFLTESKHGLNGALTFRLLTGEGRPVEEEAAGRTREGEVYWTAMLNKVALPSVLRRRAVRTESMPPDGYSAMPRSLMDVTPAELRFWLKKGKEARAIRDALVASKVFTEDNVRIVDGEFRRIVTKRFVCTGPRAEVTKQPRKAKFALAWQWWKAQQVVRAAPSKQVWRLMIADARGGLDTWALQRDPLGAEERIAGVYARATDDKLLTVDGNVEPGQRAGGLELNPTKATPSRIEIQDSGTAELLDDQKTFKKIRFAGKHLKGIYVLVQEDPKGDVWLLARGEEPGRAVAKADHRGKTFIEHAKAWVKEKGLLDDDSDYGGVLGRAVIRMAETFSREGHSGMSATFARAYFNWICDAWDGLHTMMLNDEDFKRAKAALAKRAAQDVEEIVEAAEIEKAAPPTRDGIQIWDPKKKSVDVDRARLRPPAYFLPMKPAPRPTNEFRSVDEAIEEFCTPENLKAGIIVDPKINAFRFVVEKWGGERDAAHLLMFTERIFETKRGLVNLSPALPKVSAEARGIRGDFVIDTEFAAFDGDRPVPRRELAEFRSLEPKDDELARLYAFRALYLPGRNLTAVHEIEARRALDRFLGGRGGAKHIVPLPWRLVSTEAQAREAMKWALRFPGSEGAMLKLAVATYSLGGENDAWAKLRTWRLVKAIVYDREGVKGSPGVWNFLCAVGPVSAAEAEKWAKVVTVSGERYVVLGKTGNAKLDAKAGDVIRAEFTELLLDESGDRKSLTWYGPPVVLDKWDGPPSSLGDALRQVLPGETKKDAESGPLPIEIYKTAEERFILGVVLEPNDGEDGAPLDPDTQRDVYSADDIRKTCHAWMERYQFIRVMHRGQPTTKYKLLENYIAPIGFEIDGKEIRKGTWLIAMRVVDDAEWDAVKRGERTGFSIGGSGVRIPLG